MALKISSTHWKFIVLTIIFQNRATDALAEVSGLNFTQFVGKFEYTFDQHEVITEDGYILNIFRLFQPYCSGQIRGRPVLLMHGYLLSGDCWVVSGKSGLGFLLADLCLDIWIGNSRGNPYSRDHVKLDPDKDEAFWDFSHTEFGKYDIPAMLDYVLNVTGAEDVNFVGYSQGAASFYVMCSERPEYKAKVNLMISLAPSARHFHTVAFLFKFHTECLDLFKDVIRKVGIYEVMTRQWLLPRMADSICSAINSLCSVIKDLVESKYSFHSTYVDNYTYNGLYKTFPTGTSLQNAAHYGQLVNSLEFRKFDHGPKKNFEVYGSRKPPIYNLSAVDTPVVVIYIPNDGISDARDVAWLSEQLPNVVESYLVEDDLFSHLDVIYSHYVKKLLYPKVKEYLLKYM